MPSKLRPAADFIMVGKIKRKYLPAVSIAIAVIAVSAAFLLYDFFELRREQLWDLLFTRRKTPSEIVIIAIDETSIKKIGQWPWPRRTYGKLLQNLGQAGIVGIDINFNEPSSLGGSDDSEFAAAISAASFPIVLSAKVQVDGSVSLPLEKFAGKAKSGYTNILIGADGTVRKINLALSEDFKSFAEILAGYPEIIGGDSEILRIFYTGRDGDFPVFSFSDVLEGKIPKIFFEGKTVLIGATAPDLHDFFRTPLGLLSGVTIQANAIGTMIENNYLKNFKLFDLFMISLMVVAGVWFSFRIKKFLTLIFVIFGVFVCFNLLAFILFDKLILVDLFYPNLALVIATSTSVAYGLITTRREKKFIQESFGKYLAPQIVSELVENPKKLKLGGEKKNLTILFSDIRGFTSLSEKFSPESLSIFLNRYLTEMTEIVLRKNGTVDKFIGDAVMAFWGAPLDDANHAANALETALEMIDSLQIFNRENKGKYPEIDIGIGINTGEVTVGNMGSEKRFDYTVIGDSVNLASRLEGLNKIYGTNIILSEFTVSEFLKENNPPKPLFRELDLVKVKGKDQPVKIYEMIPRHKISFYETIEGEYRAGLDNYYHGNWEEAIRNFESVLKKVSTDGPSKNLLERSLSLQKNAPLNWDGIWELTSK